MRATRRYAHALFSTGYDGFSVGADLGNRVSAAYAAPFRFAGTIPSVAITVDASALGPLETMRFIRAMAMDV